MTIPGNRGRKTGFLPSSPPDAAPSLPRWRRIAGQRIMFTFGLICAGLLYAPLPNTFRQSVHASGAEFVRLLHRCRTDCQRAFRKTFSSRSGRLIPTPRKAFSCTCSVRPASSATSSSLRNCTPRWTPYVSITPGHHHATSGTHLRRPRLTFAITAHRLHFCFQQVGFPHTDFPARRNVPSVRSGASSRLPSAQLPAPAV